MFFFFYEIFITSFIKYFGNHQASSLPIYFLELVFMTEFLKLIIAVFDLLLGCFELWLLCYCWLVTYITEIYALIVLCTFLQKKQIISKYRRCWSIFVSLNSGFYTIFKVQSFYKTFLFCSINQIG